MEFMHDPVLGPARVDRDLVLLQIRHHMAAIADQRVFTAAPRRDKNLDVHRAHAIVVFHHGHAVVVRVLLRSVHAGVGMVVIRGTRCGTEEFGARAFVCVLALATNLAGGASGADLLAPLQGGGGVGRVS